MIELELEQEHKRIASIKVIGVGGAGGNTVDSIIASGCKNIGFITVNTDAQALEQSQAEHKLQIGVKATKGLGTGTDPELGRRSAEEDLDKILEAVGDADIAFLVGGMGKGTGSGALPVVAHALKDQGILTIAVVTKPFVFEGKHRARVADTAIESLKKTVDTLIIIPNQKLLDLVGNNVPMIDAFSIINEVLSQSITGISDIITKPGHINVDFADVRAIMKDMGLAIMGTGRASGANRAREAATAAISSPILENMDIEGAQGVILNITGGKNLGLHEISDAASVIYEKADENANIIIGSVIDDSLNDQVHVTVIATGFARPQKVVAQPVTNATSSVTPVVTASTAQAPVVEVAPVAAPVAEEPVQVAQQSEQKLLEQKLPEQTLPERKLHGSRLDADDVATATTAPQPALNEAELEEAFFKELEQELALSEQKKLASEKRSEDRQATETLLDASDLDIPAFLRRKSHDQRQDEA